MKVVHKFTLNVCEEQEVDMPEGAEILSVGPSNDVGQVVVYALCERGEEVSPRQFVIRGTDGSLLDAMIEAGEFLGTVSYPNSVWHVWDVTVYEDEDEDEDEE